MHIEEKNQTRFFFFSQFLFLNIGASRLLTDRLSAYKNWDFVVGLAGLLSLPFPLLFTSRHTTACEWCHLFTSLLHS